MGCTDSTNVNVNEGIQNNQNKNKTNQNPNNENSKGNQIQFDNIEGEEDIIENKNVTQLKGEKKQQQTMYLK